MKKRELTDKIKEYGWYFIEETAHHERWGNGKGVSESISRSKNKDIPKFVAEKVIKKAKENPA